MTDSTKTYNVQIIIGLLDKTTGPAGKIASQLRNLTRQLTEIERARRVVLTAKADVTNVSRAKSALGGYYSSAAVADSCNKRLAISSALLATAKRALASSANLARTSIGMVGRVGLSTATNLGSLIGRITGASSAMTRFNNRAEFMHTALGRIWTIATGLILANTFYKLADAISAVPSRAIEQYRTLEKLMLSIKASVNRQISMLEEVPTDLATRGLTQQLVPKIETGIVSDYRDDAQIILNDIDKVLTDQAYAQEVLVNDLASQQVAWLERLAVRSVFPQQVVTDAYKLALAYNFTSIYAADLRTEEERLAKAQQDGVVTAQRLTTAMLDMLTATGLPVDNFGLIVLALSQIKGLPTLAATEIRQLVNAGLGIDQMALAMGLTVEEFQRLQAEGKILSSEFLPALIEYFEQAYGGAADEALNTLDGILSAMGDTIDVGLRTLFAPLLDTLTPKLEKLFYFLGSDEVKASLTRAGENLVNLLFGPLHPTVIKAKIKYAFDQAMLGGMPALDLPLNLLIQFAPGRVREIVRDIREELRLLGIDDEIAAVGKVAGGYIASRAAVAVAVPAILSLIGLLPVGLVATGVALGTFKLGWDRDWAGIRSTTMEYVPSIREELDRLKNNLSSIITEWTNTTELPDIELAVNEATVTILEGVVGLLQTINNLLEGKAIDTSGLQDFFTTLRNLPLVSPFLDMLHQILLMFRDVGAAGYTVLFKDAVEELKAFIEAGGLDATFELFKQIMTLVFQFATLTAQVIRLVAKFVLTPLSELFHSEDVSNFGTTFVNTVQTIIGWLETLNRWLDTANNNIDKLLKRDFQWSWNFVNIPDWLTNGLLGPGQPIIPAIPIPQLGPPESSLPQTGGGFGGSGGDNINQTSVVINVQNNGQARLAGSILFGLTKARIGSYA